MTRLLWTALVLFAVGFALLFAGLALNLIWPIYPIGLPMVISGFVLCEVQKDRSEKELAKALADHEAFLAEIKRRYDR